MASEVQIGYSFILCMLSHVSSNMRPLTHVLSLVLSHVLLSFEFALTCVLSQYEFSDVFAFLCVVSWVCCNTVFSHAMHVLLYVCARLYALSHVCSFMCRLRGLT